MKIKYTVELITPAVTAKSGTIGKEMDITIKKDVNGRSYFPAKHIKGILRGKVLEFKNALKENGKEFTEKYFGSTENKSELRFSNLIMKKNAEETEKSLGYRYGVKINRKTRTAEDNSLFSYEFIKPQNIYNGYIEFGKIEKEDFKFIIASLFHVNKIGGLKSRGIGKVKVRIDDKEINDLDNIVNEFYKKDAPYELNNEKYKKCKYELTFEEAIILQGRYTKNEIEVRKSLQGSTIRGALIQYGIDKGVKPEKLLKISVDEVIKYNGKNEEIKLASLFETKYFIGNEKEKVDKVVSTRNEYKEIKLERNSIALLNPVGSEINIKIDERTRTAEESMLFNTEYTAIKENEEIMFKGSAYIPEELFKENVEYEIKIGKFKTKGFGKAKIKFLKNEEKGKEKEIIRKRIENLNQKIVEDIAKVEKITISKSKNLNSEISELDKELREGNRKIITFDFMSDAILPMNQVKNIGEEIKILFSEIGEKLELNMKRTFVNIERLRGYSIINNKRKCDEIVITSGSVLTYSVKKEEFEDIIDKLLKIENEGIGLRRNEGFGRVRICSERPSVRDN